MATEGPLIHDGSQCTAAADLSASQFLAVKITAARSVNLASSGGEAIYGILQNKPTSGQAADVGILGVTKAVAGASFSAGAALMTNTSGQLITQTGSTHRVAVAIEAATASSQIITVALVPGASASEA